LLFFLDLPVYHAGKYMGQKLLLQLDICPDRLIDHLETQPRRLTADTRLGNFYSTSLDSGQHFYSNGSLSTSGRISAPLFMAFDLLINIRLPRLKF
jgi:hypothetical protein